MNELKQIITRESPVIFSVLGIVGFVSATVMAVRATPIALDIIEEYQEPDGGTDWEVRIDKAKILFPIYGPAIGTTLISAGMIMASLQLSNYRREAVTSMFTASQLYLHKLHSRMVDEMGTKKAEEVQAKAAGPTSSELAPTHFVGDDKVLCYDSYTGRYFETKKVEALHQAVIKLNDELFRSMFVSINDFYYELGLDSVEYGSEIGWYVEDGAVEIRLDPILTDEYRQCIIVKFTASPRHAKNGYRGGD
jgi:hypothetical protein